MKLRVSVVSPDTGLERLTDVAVGDRSVVNALRNSATRLHWLIPAATSAGVVVTLPFRTVFFISVFSSTLAWANSEPEPGSLTLPTVIETADRTNNTGLTSISGDDIQSRYGSLQNYLKSLTGMQVQHSGGLGDPVLLSVRGASGRQTTMLINGVQTNDAQGGGYDLSQIPVDMIERVEVSASGSHGGLYDSAIGGTINIITRQQEYRNQIATAIGNHGYYSASVRGNISDYISLYAGSDYSKNNFDYPVPAPWNGDARNSEETLRNAEFFRHTAQLSATTGDIVSQLHWQHQRKNIPDYFRNSPENKAHFSTREVRFTTSNGNASDSEGFQLPWSFSLSHKNESYRDPEGSIGLGEDDNRYRLRHAEVATSPQWRSGKLTLRSGLRAEFDDYQSRYVNDDDSRECNTLQGNCDQAAEQQVINLSTGADYRFSPPWTTSTSIYHRIYRTSNERTHAEDAARTQNKESFTGASASVTHFSAFSETSISARRSVRIPSLYERYGDRGLMLGNDDLTAEIADNLSLDLRLFNQQSEINLSVFVRETKDTIVAIYDSRGIGRYRNVSDSTMQGVEVELIHSQRITGITLEPMLSAASYTSELISDVRAFDGKQVPGIYHNRYLLGLTAFYRRHSLALDYELAGNLYLDSGNNSEGDIRRSLDLMYQFEHNRWNLRVAVNNLTNNQFRDYSNRPVAGRQLYISANISF